MWFGSKRAQCNAWRVHIVMNPIFSYATHVRPAFNDPVEHCKFRVREMVHSLRAKIGCIRTTGRYHPEGTRTLEHDYIVKKQSLGSGMHGAVRLAVGQNLRRHNRFAVKSFDLAKIVSSSAEADLLSELEIHLSVDHPHIVRVVDVYEASSQLHIVMECMDGGELADRMTRRRKFSEKDAAETIRQILLAVSYLHDNGIVHRDLKPENFIYSEAGGSHVKLIDFGLGVRWKDGDADLHMPCGTVNYVAPEVLNQSYTNQCDLWSIGVLSFGMLLGHLPFGGADSQTIADIKAGKVAISPEQWKTLSEKAGAFLLALLQPDHRQRLTAYTALEHPWLLEQCCEPQLVKCHSSLLVKALRHFQQIPIAHRACCMITSLAPSNKLISSELHELFVKMDTYRTGLVRIEDVKHALAGRFEKAEECDELLSNFFVKLDAGHGRMQYSVFLAAMESAAGQHHHSSIAEMFRRFDTQNVGYITKENIQELLSGTSEEELLNDLGLTDKTKCITYPAFEAHLTEHQLSCQSRANFDYSMMSQRAFFVSPWGVLAAIVRVVSELSSYHLKHIFSASGRHGHFLKMSQSWKQHSFLNLSKSNDIT